MDYIINIFNQLITNFNNSQQTYNQMKTIAWILSIFIIISLWSPFYITTIWINNNNPDVFSIIVCFQTGLVAFYTGTRFIEWFKSNIK